MKGWPDEHRHRRTRADRQRYQGSGHRSTPGDGLVRIRCIRLLLLRVADEKRLPFTVQTPNATTARAMKELSEGRGQRFDSADDLFRDLDI